MSTIITDAEALSFLRLASTIVDHDSASDQKVLYSEKTINFVTDDEVIIGRGTVREEIKTIATIQSGVSLTMTENLEFNHSAEDGDTIEVGYQDSEIIHGMNLSIDRIVKNHCSRCFNLETGAVEYLDGDGGCELWLADYPVASVVLYIDFDLDLEFGDEDLVDEDDYVVYPEIGLIYYSAGFPEGRRNVRATYNKGFTDVNMPEDLKLICKIEVKYLYSRWKEDSRGLKSYSVAGIRKTFDPTLSSFSLEVLNNNYVKKRS